MPSTFPLARLGKSPPLPASAIEHRRSLVITPLGLESSLTKMDSNAEFKIPYCHCHFPKIVQSPIVASPTRQELRGFTATIITYDVLVQLLRSRMITNKSTAKATPLACQTEDQVKQPENPTLHVLPRTETVSLRAFHNSVTHTSKLMSGDFHGPFRFATSSIQGYTTFIVVVVVVATADIAPSLVNITININIKFAINIVDFRTR